MLLYEGLARHGQAGGFLVAAQAGVAAGRLAGGRLAIVAGRRVEGLAACRRVLYAPTPHVVLEEMFRQEAKSIESA